MSHSRKKLTWYQLHLRIGKMALTQAKTQIVELETDSGAVPLSLEYTDSGNIARFVLPEGYRIIATESQC